jgi:hypothetical protein
MRRRRGGTRDWRRRHGPSPLVQAPGATWPSFVAQQASQPPAYLEWIVVEAVAAAPLPPPFSPPPSAYKYLPSTRAMTSPFTTPAPLFLFFSFPRGDLSWRRQAAGLGTRTTRSAGATPEGKQRTHPFSGCPMAIPDAGAVRRVRCPRCHCVLEEPGAPVYQCGGCGASLRGNLSSVPCSAPQSFFFAFGLVSPYLTDSPVRAQQRTAPAPAQ